eukprot:Gb_25854 [translate_table: standard]
MERWRKFFESAGTDICTLIENAIMVAASEYPQELRVRRDRIAQRLFTCRLLRCGECDALTLASPDCEDDNIKGVAIPRCEDHHHSKGSRDDSGDNKVTSSSNEVGRQRTSNYSYDEAEALTEEIEEESQIMREVDRIKDILANPDESEKQLYESLRRLELMQLSVDTLKATAIGKIVSRLKKHSSKEIRSMAKQLVSGWKDLVDVWVKTAGDVAAAAIVGTSPDSVSPEAIEDENGLPSPPLDEGAFFTTQTTSIEMSQFFDGMDDDGNPRVVDGHNDSGYDDDEKQCLVGPCHNIKQSIHQGDLVRESSIYRKQGTTGGDKERGKVRSRIQNKKNNVCNGNLLSSTNCANNSDGLPLHSSDCAIASSMPLRNSNGMPEQSKHRENVQQWTDSIKNEIKPGFLPSQNKPKCSDDVSVRVMVEAAKRKLQEGYQHAENAKRQRTIQVMDLQDLPRQNRNSVKPWHSKLGSQNRQRFNNHR